MSLEELGNVEVVTTSKEPEQVWRTPAAVFVLTEEDIRRSGATSVPEVLRLVPGVEVARIDASTWAVGIRGFGSGFSKSVLVLIDGRNVYTPLFAGVYWRQQNLMLEDVERIEVIRGPGATVWGSNAVNGVINIITKNSKDTHGFLGTVGGGNTDTGTGGFRFGQGGRHLNYRVYGMAFGRSPGFHSDGNNFDDWQLGQAGFRMDWDDQRKDSVTLQGDLYKGMIGERQAIATFSPPAELDVTGIKHVSGGNFLARWRRQLDEKSDIQLQAYYDRTYRFGSQIGESRNTFDLDLVHHLGDLSRNDIIWGLGARWSPGSIQQTAASVDFLPHQQSDNVYSAFVQDEVALVKNKLSSTLGVKFEHNIYTGWETQPSARLLWTPTKNQSLWAAVTRAVRTPSRIDEDLSLSSYVGTTALPIFVTIAGNPKFKSENSLGYEIGYRRLLGPQFYIDISTFHTKYDNLTSYGPQTITLEPPAPPLRIVDTILWANGIQGSTDGVEIAPDWKPFHALELKASYSYLNMDLRRKQGSSDDLGLVQTYEGSSPRHQVVVQSLINLPKGFEFDPTYRYVGALPGQFPSGLSASYVRPYGTVDARLGLRLSPNVQVSVVGQNLLQPHHAEFGGDPGPLIGVKRSVYAKIVWTKQ